MNMTGDTDNGEDKGSISWDWSLRSLLFSIGSDAEGFGNGSSVKESQGGELSSERDGRVRMRGIC